MAPDYSHLLSYWLRHPGLWIATIKWPLTFLAGWGAIYVRRWRKNRNEAKAQGWPSAEARIIRSKATPVANTSRYIVTLDYSFFLDQYHYGKYIHEFSKQSEAEEFARNLKDKRVQIRYNQANPEISVLEQSVIEQHILLAPRFG